MQPRGFLRVGWCTAACMYVCSLTPIVAHMVPYMLGTLAQVPIPTSAAYSSPSAGLRRSERAMATGPLVPSQSRATVSQLK